MSTPAPPVRRILAQARFEAAGLLKHGEQLIVSLMLPLMALVGLALVPFPDLAVGRFAGEERIDVLAPGVLALAVMSTAFTSLAIATGFERRYGVLKRLGSSPLPRHGLLLGKVLALLAVETVQVVVVLGVAIGLGWRPGLDTVDVLGAVLAVALGTAAFASLGLFVAGVLRAEATLAAANLVYLLLLAGGGIVIPVEEYGAASGVLGWLPSGALGEAMRAALGSATIAWPSLLVLLGWAVLGAVLTARTFRWE